VLGAIQMYWTFPEFDGLTFLRGVQVPAEVVTGPGVDPAVTSVGSTKRRG